MGHVRVINEGLVIVTSKYGPCFCSRMCLVFCAHEGLDFYLNLYTWIQTINWVKVSYSLMTVGAVAWVGVGGGGGRWLGSMHLGHCI